MNKLWLIPVLILLVLVLPASPAHAQGFSIGDDATTCFGGNTTISASSQVHDVLLVGCNGRIMEGAVVQGNAAVFGSNLTIEKGAKINGDVAVLGGNLELAGQVDGDIAVTGGAVQLDATAVVAGDVRVAGGGLTQSEGAVVRGTISRENGPDLGRALSRPFEGPFTGFTGMPYALFNAGLGFLRGMIVSLALAALGVLLVVLFPEPTRRVMETAENSTAASLGIGCLTLILTPILVVALAITVIGIPVALLLILAAAVAWAVGWIAVGYWAGRRILEGLKVHDIVPIVAVIVGVLILALVSEAPCVGWLVGLLITTLGVGAVVLTRFGTRNYPYPSMLAPMGPAPMVPATARPPEPGATLPAVNEPPASTEMTKLETPPEPPKE